MMKPSDIITPKQISENLGHSDDLDQVSEFFNSETNINTGHAVFRIDKAGRRVDALAYAIQKSAICDLDKEWVEKQSLLNRDISVFALEEFIAKSDRQRTPLRGAQATFVDKISQAKLQKILSIVVASRQPSNRQSTAETFVLETKIECGDTEIADFVADLWNGEIHCVMKNFIAFSGTDKYGSHFYWRKKNAEAESDSHSSVVSIKRNVPSVPMSDMPDNEEVERLSESVDVFMIFASKTLKRVANYYKAKSMPFLSLEKDTKETEDIRLKAKAESYLLMSQICKPEWAEWKRNLRTTPVFKPAIHQPSSLKHFYFRYGKIDKNIIRIHNIMSESFRNQLRNASDSKIADDALITFWASVQWSRWTEWLGKQTIGSEFDVFRSYSIRKTARQYMEDTAKRFLENLPSLLIEAVQTERKRRNLQ